MPYLSTIWRTGTDEGHELAIIHWDLPVRTLEAAAAAEKRVSAVHLQRDGALVCVIDGRKRPVQMSDLRAIQIYTRSPDLDKSPGQPGTLTDRVDLRASSISLQDLAELKGAAGSLQGLSFGMVNWG